MICFPNAKVNIGLYVTDKRNDGYHNIASIFMPIALKDVLEIIPAPSFQMKTLGLAIEGNPQQNLVWKAYDLLQKDFPNQVAPIAVTLYKHIPMGAGMGGGSADAAFMLRLLNSYFSLQCSSQDLKAYALQLGSDCPFFIDNTIAYATGRGETLQAISLDYLSEYSIQVISPDIHVSTATAFQGIQPKAPNVDLTNIHKLPITEWKAHIFNDFEKPVFSQYPVLASIKNQLYEQGAIYAAMTGSGSSMYGFFQKGAQASININVPFKSFYIK